MGTSDVVDKVDKAHLKEMGDMDIEDVYAQMDAYLEKRPGPLDLYKRWESQGWSASELDFTTDKDHWDNSFIPFVREQLTYAFSAFFIGEQAVTDTLSPLVIAAPTEEDRWFLSTQVVDEARHAYFFARFFNEVVGTPGTAGEAIAAVQENANSKAYTNIFGPEGDLVRLTEDVRIHPRDHAKWVKGITIYHLMIEGLLALVGQKFILRTLRILDLLPAFRAGFTAVTRDESRHVNYGVWALAHANRDGHGDLIKETVDSSLESCFRIYANPERKVEIPDEIPPGARQDPRINWSFGVDSLSKRLRVIGIDDSYIDSIGERAWSSVWSAIDEYEGLHGDEHPVRAWERGELEPLVS